MSKQRPRKTDQPAKDRARNPVGQPVEDALRIQRDLVLALGSTSDLVEAANRVLDVATRIGVLDSGSVRLAGAHIEGSLGQGSRNEDLPWVLIAHCGFSPTFIEGLKRLPVSSGRVRMMLTGRPFYGHCRDLPPAGLPDDERGLRGSAMLPISHQGRVIASLNLVSHTHDEVPPADRVLLEALASDLGGVFARIRAESDLREQLHLLQTMLDAIPQPIFYKALDRRFWGCNQAWRRFS